MKVPFEKLPESAKVWMYQSSKALDSSSINVIQELSDVFLDQWESHGIPVQGAVDVVHDHFIRIAAFTDEASMCGRAQDAQVRLAKELEQELGVELTNRMMLVFNVDGNDQVVHMNDVQSLVDEGKITGATPFYNNLVHSKKEYEQDWKVNAGATWLERYF